jgi:hypothetical protein
MFEVASQPTIILRVYGNSKSSDRASLHIREELQQILQEHTQVYQTQPIFMVRNFFVALEEGDTNRSANNKPLTTEILQTLLADNHLVNIVAKTNYRMHKWY